MLLCSRVSRVTGGSRVVTAGQQSPPNDGMPRVGVSGGQRGINNTSPSLGRVSSDSVPENVFHV